nr:hypothetical protein [Mycobacterium avium]
MTGYLGAEPAKSADDTPDLNPTAKGKARLGRWALSVVPASQQVRRGLDNGVEWSSPAPPIARNPKRDMGVDRWRRDFLL